MPEPIFKIRNVTKFFGNHLVLNNINLDIYSGEILGVIGASGSGKTTLLNSIIGFLRPERGDVLFRLAHLLDFKQTITYRSVYKQRESVKTIYGFAAQQPSFYEKLTVRENLEYFGTLYNLSKDAIQTNVETLLSLMDLKRSEKILSGNLSGGMERRLDIACGLMHDPDVLFLDEPTADLDPVLRDHIWDLIKKINKKGTTIVLSSHHLLELEKLCTRIVMLKNGRILEIGSPEDLKAKFSKGEEIIIETYPADYKKIISKVKHKSISKIQMQGTQLHIKTSNPGTVLKLLLGKLEELKESLIDIKVSRPTLDDIFIALSKDKPKPKIQSREEVLEEQPHAVQADAAEQPKQKDRVLFQIHFGKKDKPEEPKEATPEEHEKNIGNDEEKKEEVSKPAQHKTRHPASHSEQHPSHKTSRPAHHKKDGHKDKTLSDLLGK